MTIRHRRNTPSRRTRELVVSVRAEVATVEALAGLRRKLDLVPGPVSVRVEVALPSGACAVLELPKHRVAVSAELLAELDDLFGERVARCVVS